MADHDDTHDEDSGPPESEPKDEPERDAVSEADELADEIEDELADAVSEPERELPRALLVPALVVFAAIVMPLHPDGFSFAQLLYAAFLRSPLEALVVLLGFGSPFLFGLIVALVAGFGERLHPLIAQRLLVTNLSFLHAQLLLVAYVLWSGGQGMLPFALLGFAVVSGGAFVVSHARAAASGEGSGPTPRWLIRWGASVIVAICGWIRLQMLVEVRFGWAVEVVLAGCVAMTVLVIRKR